MAAACFESSVGLQVSPSSDDTHSLYDPDIDGGEFDGSFQDRGWDIESPLPTTYPAPSLAPSPVLSPRSSPAPIAPDPSPASASAQSTPHVPAITGQHADTDLLWIKPTDAATEPSGATLRVDMDALAIILWFIKHGPKEARRHLRSYFLVAHKQYELSSLELVLTCAHAFRGRVQKEGWTCEAPLVHWVQRLTVEDLLKSRAAVLAFKAAALEAWHRHGSRISHQEVDKILIGKTPRTIPDALDTEMPQHAPAMELASLSVPAPAPSTVDVQVGGRANKTGSAVAGPTAAGDLSFEDVLMDIDDNSADTESAASTPSAEITLPQTEAVRTEPTPALVVAAPVARAARTFVGQQQPGSSYATATCPHLGLPSRFITGSCSSSTTTVRLSSCAAGFGPQRSSLSVGVDASAFTNISQSQTTGMKRRRDDGDEDDHDAVRAHRLADGKKARLMAFIQTTMGLTVTEEKRCDRVVPEVQDNPFVGLLDGFTVKHLKPVARAKLRLRGANLKSKAVMVRAAAAALEAKLRMEYAKDIVDDMLDL